jgi:tetratricopeptide (TPR) repeat protein
MNMRNFSRKIITLRAVLIFLVFSSCIPQRNAGIDKSLVDRARMKSEQYVVQGDYKSALDVYADACRKYPDDQTLFTHYIKTMKDIHHAASEAFSREDFASSGCAYSVLLKNNSYCQELFRDQALDKGILHARLEDCSAQLSLRALAEYRKGNLAEAIPIWKKILEFDPNNAGVMKAMDTATIQLKNLQQKRE